MARKKKVPVTKFGLQAFAHIHLLEDGKIVGDSGWVRNKVVAYGIETCLGSRLLGGTNYGAWAAVGTGGEPATNTTALPGENTQVSMARDSCSTSVVTGAGASNVTCRWYGTFASTTATSAQHITTTQQIGNIGIYTGSATNGSNLLCGATYTASTWNTNQDVNYTYEWQFATTT